MTTQDEEIIRLIMREEMEWIDSFKKEEEDLYGRG